MKQEIKTIPITELNLWTENPRDPIEIETSDFEIIKRALSDSKSKWDLQGLINKMGLYYDLSELPTVVEIDSKYIVYDGNRRIAILKYLQNSKRFEDLNLSLYFDEEPTELKLFTEIPCNLCDIDTALKNIERKHTNSGDWGRLERDYFALKHLKKEKSHFISLDEQTGIISNNDKMNQRFVKDEMLTKENLSKIGFEYRDNKFVSNYDKKTSNKIIESIVRLVQKGIVNTRNNRHKLKEPLLKHNPDLKKVIKPFDDKKKVQNLTYKKVQNTPKKADKKPRKTQTSKENTTLFGKTLELKLGKVNDLYRAILRIYESNEKDATILPIIGMSLRLITEVAARTYFDKNDPKKAQKDQVYNDFLKVAKKEMNLKQADKNYLSLTTDWLDNKNNIEAILAKYAHGNIPVSRDGILKNSFVIGEILEHYYKK
jgi:hypothetical protein